MSITNKKIDVLRRLFLGPLYSECKDNPIGVSRDQLQKRLDKLINDGCVLDCNVDEMVKTCNLKSHYPTCSNDRKCIEDTWPQQSIDEKFSYQQYKNAKIFENEPDTDEEDEKEEEDVCPICNEKEDEEGNPVKEMNCGHKIHISCLIQTAKGMGRDIAECPLCRRKFSLLEVPVPERDVNQRMADSLSNAIRDASQNESPFLSQLTRLERQVREPQNEEISPNFRLIANQIDATRINQNEVMEENEIEAVRPLIERLEETTTTERERYFLNQYKFRLAVAIRRRNLFLQDQENQRLERERRRNEEISPNFRLIANQIDATRINQDVVMEEDEIEAVRLLIRSLEEIVNTQRERSILSDYKFKLRLALQIRSRILQNQENERRQREREERQERERQEREREREERRQREREREERRQRDMEEIGQTRTRSGRVSRRRS